jgi:hypothetical protein
MRGVSCEEVEALAFHIARTNLMQPSRALTSEQVVQVPDIPALIWWHMLLLRAFPSLMQPDRAAHTSKALRGTNHYTQVLFRLRQ